MAAIIHMVRPTRAVTFAEYVSLNGVLFLENQLTSTVERVNAIWDTYPEKLKSLTQKRRWTGVRTRLELNSDGSTPILKREWQSYLNHVDNKRELFSCISKRLARDGADKQLNIDMKTLSPATRQRLTHVHVYFCTWPMQHIRVAKKAFVRTVDSDIVVLALSLFENVRLAELWIGFGSGKSYRDIPVHIPHQQLGQAKSIALPLFNSLTGCDTALHILSFGKKSSRNAWQNTPDRDIDCSY